MSGLRRVLPLSLLCVCACANKAEPPTDDPCADDPSSCEDGTGGGGGAGGAPATTKDGGGGAKAGTGGAKAGTGGAKDAAFETVAAARIAANTEWHGAEGHARPAIAAEARNFFTVAIDLHDPA